MAESAGYGRMAVILSEPAKSGVWSNQRFWKWPRSRYEPEQKSLVLDGWRHHSLRVRMRVHVHWAVDVRELACSQLS